MTNVAKKQKGFFGFESATEMKGAVIEQNPRETKGADAVALVIDGADKNSDPHLLVRRKSGDKLYAILPDSKRLVEAKYRASRLDLPFIFEVLA